VTSASWSPSSSLGKTVEAPAPQALPALTIEPARLPRSAWQLVWNVASGRYRFILFGLVLSEAIHSTCGILLPYALSRILSRVTTSHGDGAIVFQSLRGPLIFFAALCIGELLFGRLNSAIHLRVAPRQRHYVARALFQYLHGHSHRFLNENFAGALAHRISETALGVNQVLWTFITEFWPISIVIVVSNVLLARAHPLLGAFTGIWSLAFISISLWLAKRTQPLSHAAANARSHTVGVVVDSVSNHAAVRLFARLGYERRRLEQTHLDELVTVTRANDAMERIRVFQFAASALLKAGLVLVSTYLWSRGAIGIPELTLAVTLSLLIIAEVRNLGRRFLELFDYLGNVASGVRAILLPHELTDREDAQSQPIARGAIAFDQVDFRYPDGSQVFRDLSVSIPEGQRVGLVGLSGSGKSTFVSLLLRLYDPQAGAIRIDGIDLRALTQESLHAQLGLIPQDPTLFHRTLRENIRYGRAEASDEEVELAARRAHAHEFIVDNPEGYGAIVGERGVKLSGGQRQRIAIARVILKDAPVLILDEATSSLDSLTEHAIQSALNDVMRNKTVLVIAHRLSTVAHLDRILVFSGGRIIEDGSHAELLRRRGAYHALWSRQVDAPGAHSEQAAQ
jgi:ATP-binding cassette, subfamily B, bacterial